MQELLGLPVPSPHVCAEEVMVVHTSATPHVPQGRSGPASTVFAGAQLVATSVLITCNRVPKHGTRKRRRHHDPARRGSRGHESGHNPRRELPHYTTHEDNPSVMRRFDSRGGYTNAMRRPQSAHPSRAAAGASTRLRHMRPASAGVRSAHSSPNVLRHSLAAARRVGEKEKEEEEEEVGDGTAARAIMRRTASASARHVMQVLARQHAAAAATQEMHTRLQAGSGQPNDTTAGTTQPHMVLYEHNARDGDDLLSSSDGPDSDDAAACEAAQSELCEPHLGEASVAVMCRLLVNNQYLRRLEVTPPGSIDATPCLAIAHAMARNSVLQELQLSDAVLPVQRVKGTGDPIPSPYLAEHERLDGVHDQAPARANDDADSYVSDTAQAAIAAVAQAKQQREEEWRVAATLDLRHQGVTHPDVVMLAEWLQNGGVTMPPRVVGADALGFVPMSLLNQTSTGHKSGPPSLTSLNVRDNSIGDFGALLLVEALKVRAMPLLC